MSYTDASQPECRRCQGAIALVIRPRERDLGEFTVRRVLPAAERRAVGPFVFFDHMGPAEFPPGQGIAVRPHPHIGLATVTYLFEGQILHRDSLGFVQPIRAGAVNLMTAGRGIVHSERAGEDLDRLSTLHGIQSWMALPADHAECEPAFVHHPADTLPEVERDGARIRVIIGSAYGETSPVQVLTPMLYLELTLPRGNRLVLPDDVGDRALYTVSGEIAVDTDTYSAGEMLVACDGAPVCVEARSDAHVMLIGGEPVGPRRMWWNFVATSMERIEQAKADWRDGRFGEVPGDDEFIPLPER